MNKIDIELNIDSKLKKSLNRCTIKLKIVHKYHALPSCLLQKEF